jgi:hypothetical protein
MIPISPEIRATEPAFAKLADAFNTALEVCTLNQQTIANLNSAIKCWQNVAAMREAENATLRARLAAALQQRAA